MADSLENSLSVFTASQDPVIAVKNEIVTFANPAAEKTFPDLAVGDSASVYIPEILLQLSSNRYVSTAKIRELQTVISCASVDNTKIYCLSIENDTRTSFAPPALIASMRSSIFTMRMAADKLVEAASPESDPRLSTYSSILYHNYHSLLHFTGNLYTAEGLASGTLPFQPTASNLVSVCKELVNSVISFVAQNGVELSFKCAEDYICGNVDRALFEQMLLNLLSNSLGMLDKGGRIALELCLDGDNYIITVTDNGGGIDHSTLSTLFFSHKNHDISELSNGHTGLGLYIVRGISELHGGTIIVETIPDMGTTARLIMPIDHSSHTLLRTTELEYHAAALNSILTELSSYLDYKHYSPKYLMD